MGPNSDEIEVKILECEFSKFYVGEVSKKTQQPLGRGFIFDQSDRVFTLGYFDNGKLKASFDRDEKNNYITTIPKSLNPDSDMVAVGELYKNEAGLFSMRGFHHFRTGQVVAFDEKVPLLN